MLSRISVVYLAEETRWHSKLNFLLARFRFEWIWYECDEGRIQCRSMILLVTVWALQRDCHVFSSVSWNRAGEVANDVLNSELVKLGFYVELWALPSAYMNLTEWHIHDHKTAPLEPMVATLKPRPNKYMSISIMKTNIEFAIFVLLISMRFFCANEMPIYWSHKKKMFCPFSTSHSNT